MGIDDIVKRCKNGDRAAWKQLYDVFAPKMFAICRRYFPYDNTANDLLHDGFIKVFSKIDNFRGEGSFEGWMRRVFVTMALERLRHDKKMVFGDCEMAASEDSGDYDQLLERISQNELLKLMESMPLGYRTVLKLYCVEGYSHKEIAKMLEITPETSRSQLSRAKVELKNLLKRC
ncbi:MAG: sigma-70 family RNA polymerase sigma factor [Rikenellaceae bacterium]